MSLPWSRWRRAATAPSQPFLSAATKRRPRSRRNPGAEGLEPRTLLSVATQSVLTLTSQKVKGIDTQPQPPTGDAIAVDRSGNTYISGKYSGNVSIPGIPAILNGDQYLAKIDGKGKAVWAVNLRGDGGQPSDFTISSMAVALDGSVTMVGYVGTGTTISVSSPVRATDGVDDPTVLNQLGDVTGMIINFDNNGVFQWRRTIESATIQEARLYSVVTDSDSNVYVSGYYKNSTNNSSQEILSLFNNNLTNSEGIRFKGSRASGSFVMKFDGYGNYTWASDLPCDDSFPVKMAIDGAGDIQLVGKVSQNAQIAGTPFAPGSGKSLLYLAKLSPKDGSVKSARSFAKGETNLDVGGVTFDGAGNRYIAGSYSGTLTIDSAVLKSSGANPDLFFAKADSDGKLSWAVSYGSTGPDRVSSLARDDREHFFLAGSYEGTINFGSLSLSSVGSSDLFLAGVNSDGKPFSALGGGGSGADAARSIAVSPSGLVALAGSVVGSEGPTPSVGGTPVPAGGGAILARFQLVGPTAAVLALPSEVHTRPFNVQWKGTPGAEITSFDVSASVDGGPLTPWLVDTTLTQADYLGEEGHRYGFAVVAIDAAGLRSPLPTSSQATTLVRTLANTTTSLRASAGTFKNGQGATLSATVKTSVTWAGTPSGTVQFLLDGQPLGAAASLDGGVATSPPLPTLSAGVHKISAAFTGTGPFLASTAAPLTATIAATNGGGKNETGGRTTPIVFLDTTNPDDESETENRASSTPIVSVLGTLVHKKKSRILDIQISFSGAVDPTSAQDRANYRLVGAGRDRKFGTRDDKPAPLASLRYDAASNSALVVPRGKLKPGSYQLTITSATSSGLRDPSGRPLSGGDSIRTFKA